VTAPGPEGAASGREAPRLSVADLAASPNALAPHYARFRVADRLLLTGHSHQAWPDVGLDGQRQAWLDAAELVDAKWDRAFARADRVRRGFARLLEDEEGDYALDANTHALVVRFLSALPLRERPRIVTTDGEFHTLRRQLDRLAEEGIDVVKVASDPADSVGDRLASATDGRTATVLVSSVFFHNAHIAGGLADAAAAARRHGATLMVDAYHSLDVVPFTLAERDLADAFVLGGGYKYAQLGEGNCFLRIPPGCELRPAITGWFSEFSALEAERDADAAAPAVAYGEGPDRFAGSTYDPTSHYRASEVFDFFDAQGLTPDFLREVSRHQVGLLAARFDALDLDPAVIDRDRTVPLERIGGFLALRAPRAGELSSVLSERGVLTDYRGEMLRLGPAPYLCDAQLEAAIDALAEAARAL